MLTKEPTHDPSGVADSGLRRRSRPRTPQGALTLHPAGSTYPAPRREHLPRAPQGALIQDPISDPKALSDTSDFYLMPIDRLSDRTKSSQRFNLELWKLSNKKSLRITRKMTRNINSWWQIITSFSFPKIWSITCIMSFDWY